MDEALEKIYNSIENKDHLPLINVLQLWNDTYYNCSYDSKFIESIATLISQAKEEVAKEILDKLHLFATNAATRTLPCIATEENGGGELKDFSLFATKGYQYAMNQISRRIQELRKKYNVEEGE